MNHLKHLRAAGPALTAAAAALLLNAAALAALSQLPTRGEQVLASAYAPQFAALDRAPGTGLHPVAASASTSLHLRLARMAHSWLGHGRPTAASGPV